MELTLTRKWRAINLAARLIAAESEHPASKAVFWLCHHLRDCEAPTFEDFLDALGIPHQMMGIVPENKLFRFQSYGDARDHLRKSVLPRLIRLIDAYEAEAPA